jgi:hypothetical protein
MLTVSPSKILASRMLTWRHCLNKLKRSTWQGFLSTEQNRTKTHKKEQLLKGTAAKSRDLIYVVAVSITQTSTLSRDEHFYTENRAVM